MFWEWYCERFSVWVKIIAYDAIIIFCHPIKVAIFAVSNFFSLFWIAVFNIPSSHKIIVLLFLMQSYCFFRYFQTFFNFFLFWRLDLPTIANFVFMPVVLCSSLFRWCVSSGVFFSCRSWSPDNHKYAHIYARTRTRTGIFRPLRNF